MRVESLSIFLQLRILWTSIQAYRLRLSPDYITFELFTHSSFTSNADVKCIDCISTDCLKICKSIASKVEQLTGSAALYWLVCKIRGHILVVFSCRSSARYRMTPLKNLEAFPLSFLLIATFYWTPRYGNRHIAPNTSIKYLSCCSME